ncbi:sensor histidine kinase [Fimbriiglobus ruber]|uniref:histidine kinase n=1 Tax=Fimbriiglobus ruber TaxID=1908690 RepID=A0A225E1I6_9BACT|nr:HAMP domain-containing sensor histidine kinase [Fimbriiglobus ruber]OWK47431.1 sensor histidine kinase [Fimbriiglobus ruber]
MTRRLFGPAGACCAFLFVVALVAGGLGWVTIASLDVETDRRAATARADRSSQERLALWRLDGRMLPAVGLENNRPFAHYTALHAAVAAALDADPEALPAGPLRLPSPLLSADLNDWMVLHFQIDPDTGWESPQVLPGELAERLSAAPNNLVLSNVTPQRAQLLSQLRVRFPTASVIQALSDRERATPDDNPFVVPVPLADETAYPKPGIVDPNEPPPGEWRGPAINPDPLAQRTDILFCRERGSRSDAGCARDDGYGPDVKNGLAGAQPTAKPNANSNSNPAKDQALQSQALPPIVWVPNPNSAPYPNNPNGLNQGYSGQFANPATGAATSNTLPNQQSFNGNRTIPYMSNSKNLDGSPEFAARQRATAESLGVRGGLEGSAQKGAQPGPYQQTNDRIASDNNNTARNQGRSVGPPAPIPPVTSTGSNNEGREKSLKTADNKNDNAQPEMQEAKKAAPSEPTQKRETDQEAYRKLTEQQRLAKANDVPAIRQGVEAGKKPPPPQGNTLQNFHLALARDRAAAEAAGSAAPAERKGGPVARPTAVHVGPLRPLWLTAADGTEELVLVRAARLEHKTVYQGVLLDWARVRQVLKEQVVDLFPAAELVPVRAADDPSPERAMTALPVQLDPGPVPELAPAGWTPLRIGLVLAWAAALLALAAVWFGGQALLGFSEDRIRFVSAVTHELRTPLTSLRLYLDLLTSGLISDPEQQKEYLTTLTAESDRLNRLIENVLDFARLEKRSSARATLQATNVANLLDEIRRTWADRCAADGKELVVISTLPADQAAHTDIRVAAQIIGNLIDNARKYSRDAADARIWVWAKPGRRKRLVIEVEDRGPGVPAREQRSVFRPFRRGKTTDTVAGGAGLGLALAVHWADLLGGKLSYRPADGGVGACFRLELPAKM